MFKVTFFTHKDSLCIFPTILYFKITPPDPKTGIVSMSSWGIFFIFNGILYCLWYTRELTLSVFTAVLSEVQSKLRASCSQVKSGQSCCNSCYAIADYIEVCRALCFRMNEITSLPKLYPLWLNSFLTLAYNENNERKKKKRPIKNLALLKWTVSSTVILLRFNSCSLDNTKNRSLSQLLSIIKLNYPRMHYFLERKLGFI